MCAKALRPWLAAWAVLAQAVCAAPAPAWQFDPAAVPSTGPAQAPVLAAAPDGALTMAWWERSGPAWQLRESTWIVSRAQWGPAHAVSGSASLGPAAPAPAALACGAAGHLVAAWTTGVPAETVLVSESEDDGLTWTGPRPLAASDHRASQPALAALADGSVLAVWVDGPAGPRNSHLSTRFVTGPFARGADFVLGADAATAGTPRLLPLLDGGAVLAYRARTDGGAADPKLERLHGHHWQQAHVISADGWVPEAAPGDDLNLAVDGGRVAAVWFTAAAGQARLLAATSPDAGLRFRLPVRVDLGQPEGRPAVALLHDGAVVVAWRERAAGGNTELYLRRLSPEFSPGPPIDAGPGASGETGAPQLALLQDYAGEVTTASILLTYAGPATAPGLHATILTIPESDLLDASGDDCHCAPTPEQLRGFSFRGTVVAAGPGPDTTWEIDAVPGVMDAGPQRLRASAEVRAELHPGDHFLGRLERRNDGWWIFDLRRLAEPK